MGKAARKAARQVAVRNVTAAQRRLDETNYDPNDWTTDLAYETATAAVTEAEDAAQAAGARL